MLKRRIPMLSVLLVALALGAIAFAGRNSAGTYSLPNAPVITGTTITSTWANTTLNDLKTEMTSSLDRSGRGGMLAPLAIVSGTASAPGLSAASEPSSGLYRNSAGDWRFSVLTVDSFKWTTALVTSLVPLLVTGRTTTSTLTVTGVTDALVVTPIAANTQAIVATGTGTANGVFAAGGPTSGLGVFAQGGAPNGNGLSGVGTGSGWGVNGVGGNTAGVGVRATAGTGGIGVLALGNGAAAGVSSTGGATSGAGVIATGGLPVGIGVVAYGKGNSPGVYVQGGLTGVGLQALPGTAATAGVRSTALWANTGDISLAGTTNPDYPTPLTNTITPMNIVKAWGNFTIGVNPGAAISIGGGFNINSAVASTDLGTGFSQVDIAFASNFTSTFYAVNATMVGTAIGCAPYVVAQATNYVSIGFWTVATISGGGGIVVKRCTANGISGGAVNADRAWAGMSFSIMAIGAQ